MQEEVNEKTVSLCITGGKVTVRLLKQAMMRFLAAMEKEKAEKARKQQAKGPPDKDYRGKQSLKKLAQQNVQLSNIEITDNNIKAFEKVAKKYGKTPAQVMLRWHIQRGVVVIPKSTHIERMEENFNVFDFTLSEDDMQKIAELDKAESAFFSHQDPNMVEWFVKMVEERKKNHDSAKEKKNW